MASLTGSRILSDVSFYGRHTMAWWTLKIIFATRPYKSQNGHRPSITLAQETQQKKGQCIKLSRNFHINVEMHVKVKKYVGHMQLYAGPDRL